MTTKAPSIIDVVARISQSYPDLSEDLRAEADLAIIEADRDGHDDEWVMRRLERFATDENRHRRDKIKDGYDDRCNCSSSRPSEATEVLIPSTMTKGQRKRFHRDMIIQIASAAGVPARIIGEVFGLRHSRVYAICQEDLRVTARPHSPQEHLAR